MTIAKFKTRGGTTFIVNSNAVVCIESRNAKRYEGYVRLHTTDGGDITVQGNAEEIAATLWPSEFNKIKVGSDFGLWNEREPDFFLSSIEAMLSALLAAESARLVWFTTNGAASIDSGVLHLVEGNINRNDLEKVLLQNASHRLNTQFVVFDGRGNTLDIFTWRHTERDLISWQVNSQDARLLRGIAVNTYAAARGNIK